MYYEDDLAYIHDVGFGQFAQDAGTFLLQQFRSADITDGLVVDVGCGSGIWARRLLDAGYDVHGIDIASGMLRIARRRAPAARFVRGSLYEAKIPECRAVTCNGEIINYTACGRVTWAMRCRFFRRVYHALLPGGIFALDFATPGRTGRDGQHERIFEGDDWLLTLKCREVRRRLTREMTIFRQQGRHYRRVDECHELDLLDPAKVIAELRAQGFRVRRVKKYHKKEFPAGYTALLARK